MKRMHMRNDKVIYVSDKYGTYGYEMNAYVIENMEMARTVKWKEDVTLWKRMNLWQIK